MILPLILIVININKFHCLPLLIFAPIILFGVTKTFGRFLGRSVVISAPNHVSIVLQYCTMV